LNNIAFTNSDPAGHRPRISVIIPVHNGESVIDSCLSGVFASDYDNFEVVIADDQSTDGTLAKAGAFKCDIVELASNQGPGAARNAGVERASGDILFFLDADILIGPATLSEIARLFSTRPDVSAMFGSYQKDTVPSNFCSVYKNLIHHYTHQISREHAETFCGGFGAIRRSVFSAVGGFDERHRYLEDIELGYRLRASGYKIILKKELQFTHCKQYSFIGLVKSDLFGRAIPWTRLMLEKKTFNNDLNTRVSNILSLPVAFAILLSLPAAYFFPPSAPLLLVLPATFVLLNSGFLSFTLRERGPIFAARAAGMSWLSYLYSGFGLAAGLATHFLQSLKSKDTSNQSENASNNSQHANKSQNASNESQNANKSQNASNKSQHANESQNASNRAVTVRER
jgi:glycosyltransferase involved in cell wall biosynthesis